MKIRKDRTFILRSEAFAIMMMISKKDPVLKFQILMDQVKGTNIKIATFSGGHMSHIENTRELIHTLKIFVN